MTFLYPLFFLALASLAIPIIIHLFRFQKLKKVRFSDISFLRRALTESQRRSRLRHWLLLALRLTALALLVTAFAFPVKKGGNLVSGRTKVFVYLDNSLSMEASSGTGTLLDAAREKAEALMKAFGEAARFHVWSSSPLAGGGRETSLQDALNQVASIPAGGPSKNLSSVVRRVQQEISSRPEDKAGNIVVFISDFQKHVSDFQTIAWAEGTPEKWLWVPVQPRHRMNVTVDSAWVQPAFPGPNQAVNLRFRLRNYGKESADEVPVEIFVNGEKKSGSMLRIPAGGTTEFAYAVTLPAQDDLGVEFRLEDGAATFDNRFFVCLRSGIRRRVQVWYDDPATPVIQALATEPAFDVTAVPKGQADYFSLSQADVVFLCGIQEWTTGLAAAIKDFVSKGGTAVLFPPAKPGSPEDHQAFQATFGLSWPGIPRNNPGRVRPASADIPFFEGVFEKTDETIQWPQVSVGYITTWPGAEKIMTFSGGEAFWQRLSFGQGHIMACATPLSADASNFTVHGLFVPVILRSVMSSRPLPPLYYAAGRESFSYPLENEAIPNSKAGIQEEPVRWVNVQNPDLIFIPEQVYDAKKVTFFLRQETPPPGIYRLERAGEKLGQLALNAPGPESIPEYFSPEELQEIIQNENWGFTELLTGRPDELAAHIQGQSENGRSRWWPFLLAAACALAAEALFSRTWTWRKMQEA